MPVPGIGVIGAGLARELAGRIVAERGGVVGRGARQIARKAAQAARGVDPVGAAHHPAGAVRRQRARGAVGVAAQAGRGAVGDRGRAIKVVVGVAHIAAVGPGHPRAPPSRIVEIRQRPARPIHALRGRGHPPQRVEHEAETVARCAVEPGIARPAHHVVAVVDIARVGR